LKAMYLSANAALSQAERYDILANNLANANTVGFKPQRPQFREVLAEAVTREYGESAVEALAGSTLAGAGDVMTPGIIEYTDNAYDLALTDEGFFTVERDGKFYFTRAGNFREGPEGYLTTADGSCHLLLKNGVPVVVGNADFQVDNTGLVVLVDAEGNRQPLGYLWIVKPRQNNYAILTRRGNNLWSAPMSAMERVDTPGVAQGAIEKSVVSAVEEMTSLISAMRAYEAAMRFVRIQDEALGLAATELARPLGA
jgi:flagellar basal body rod protein FlgG